MPRASQPAGICPQFPRGGTHGPEEMGWVAPKLTESRLAGKEVKGRQLGVTSAFQVKGGRRNTRCN